MCFHNLQYVNYMLQLLLFLSRFMPQKVYFILLMFYLCFAYLSSLNIIQCFKIVFFQCRIRFKNTVYEYRGCRLEFNHSCVIYLPVISCIKDLIPLPVCVLIHARLSNIRNLAILMRINLASDA